MLKRCLLFALLFFLALPMTASALGVGDKAPSFSGTELYGKSVDLGKILGKQPVMLVFWASW